MTNHADAVEQLTDGWRKAMGVRVVVATEEECVVEMDVGPQHLQPLGIVHGGVHAGLVETAASIGAGVWAMTRGMTVVGLENHTSFIHAVRGGKLVATAKPLTRGRRSQAWEVVVKDETGRIASTGRLRLLVLQPDSDLAGEKPTAR